MSAYVRMRARVRVYCDYAIGVQIACIRYQAKDYKLNIPGCPLSTPIKY